MRFFYYEQLTNIGGGTFFIVGGHGRPQGGGHLLPLVIGIRTKISRKPEVNSLIPILPELILAMPVYFPV